MRIYEYFKYSIMITRTLKDTTICLYIEKLSKLITYLNEYKYNLCSMKGTFSLFDEVTEFVLRISYVLFYLIHTKIIKYFI